MKMINLIYLPVFLWYALLTLLQPCISVKNYYSLPCPTPMKIGSLLCPPARDIKLVLLYSVDFKAPCELWYPLRKTVLNTCSFVWQKGPVNTQNDRKDQKELVCGTCKYLQIFDTDVYIVHCLWSNKERYASNNRHRMTTIYGIIKRCIVKPLCMYT